MNAKAQPRPEASTTGYGVTAGIPVKRLFHYHDTVSVRAQMFVSALAASGFLLLLAYIRDNSIESHYRTFALIAAFLIWGVYSFVGVFRRQDMPKHVVFRLTKAWVVVVVMLLLVGFATKTTDEFSRLVFGGWVLGGYFIQLACVFGSASLNRRYYPSMREPIRTLVIGSGQLATHLVSSLSNNRWLPDEIVGIVDNDGNGRSSWDRSLAPVLGRTNELLEIIKKEQIKRVYIALPLSQSDMVETISKKMFNSQVDLIWAPDIFSMPLLNHGSREVAGVPLLTLSESPMAIEGQLFLKSTVDRLLAALMVVTLSPVLLLAAVMVKLTSPGPVLFKQLRNGWDGKVIEIWKFRSMYVHEEEGGKVTQASRRDSRVTPVGRFLRRTSIDELPQLFNVLSGEMSLVGPRPHALEHDEYYAMQIPDYMLRHRIKPGITGLAQISGCRGETAELGQMKRRVDYDLQYINHWSLLWDLQILLKTPLALFSKDIY